MKEQKLNEGLVKHIDKVYQQYGWNPEKKPSKELNSEGDLLLKEPKQEGQG